MEETLIKEKLYLYHMTTGLPISIYSSNGQFILQLGIPQLPFTFLGIFPIEIIMKKRLEIYYNHLTDYEEHFISLNVTCADNKNYIVVIGPFKYKMLPFNQIRKIAKNSQLDKDETIALQKYYHSLPAAKIRSIYQHYKYLEILFDSTSMIFQNTGKDLINSRLMERNKIEYREIDFYHHNYLWEKRIDSLFKDRIYPFPDNELSNVEPAILSMDPDRNQKILSIISIAVFERYAVQHGLDPAISFTIADKFLRMIEQSKKTSDFDTLMQESVKKYRKALELVNQSKYSKIVNEAIRYINRNLFNKCSLTKASSLINVHPDYLSKLFIQELGISFTDYILGEKLEEAKIHLRYSNKSLAEISKILGFSTKSYFIQCFKKHEGITPGEYLKQINVQETILLKRTPYKENMYLYHMTTGLPISIYTLDGVLIHQIGIPKIPFEFLSVFPIDLMTHDKLGSYSHHQTVYEEHFICARFKAAHDKGFAIVIGPYKYKMPTSDQIIQICENAGVSKFTTVAMQKYYYSLPTAKMTTTNEQYSYLKLLFESSSIVIDDMMNELIDDQQDEKNGIDYGEIEFYHHNHLLELRNIDLLFKGRIHPFSDTELSNIELAVVSNDYVRDSKNISTMDMSLFGRYAIEQGLDTHISFTMNDTYLRMIEKSQNLSDIDIYMQDAFRKYLKALEKVNHSNYSKIMNEAIRFINHNLSQNFSLVDVANHVKVHPNYLSELIKRELGMTFTHYVLKEKIEEAKILLKYSNNSLSEISGILNFSSKSYFIKCFKKVEGVTPGEYINHINKVQQK